MDPSFRNFLTVGLYVRAVVTQCKRYKDNPLLMRRWPHELHHRHGIYWKIERSRRAKAQRRRGYCECGEVFESRQFVIDHFPISSIKIDTELSNLGAWAQKPRIHSVKTSSPLSDPRCHILKSNPLNRIVLVSGPLSPVLFVRHSHHIRSLSNMSSFDFVIVGSE